jgi:hypothetical protein
MSARENILQFKHDIRAMQKESALSRMVLADALFENFVDYAVANWDYGASSGGLTADVLLSGTGRKTVACGTLREALKKMFRDDLNRQDVADADLGHFISKPDLHCFDPKVKGNLGNRGSGMFNLGCLFSGHWFLACGDKFYDPCLQATYMSKEEPIFQKTTRVGTLAQSVPGVEYAGLGKATILLRKIPNKTLPGFGDVFEIIKLNEVTTVFSGEDLRRIRATPALRGLI